MSGQNQKPERALYVFDASVGVAGEWVPATPGLVVGASPAVFIRRTSDGAQINPATEETLLVISAKDFATQTTLAAALTALNTIAGKDFATQTTLAALNTKVKTQGRMYAILAGLILDTEEARYDIIGPPLPVTDIYVGVAVDGSATSAAVWDVVRAYFTSGLPVRKRLKTAIKWDDRAVGW